MISPKSDDTIKHRYLPVGSIPGATVINPDVIVSTSSDGSKLVLTS